MFRVGEWAAIPFAYSHYINSPTRVLGQFGRTTPLQSQGWFFGLDRDRCLFRRGFVATVECRCENWLQHGPAVVACQPVERVRLTDREPSVNAYGGDRVAWQSSSSDDDLSSWVPYHLLKLMSAIVGEDLDGQTWLVFDNQQVALDALSTACLLWARQQAGLATTNA